MIIVSPITSPYVRQMAPLIPCACQSRDTSVLSKRPHILVVLTSCLSASFQRDVHCNGISSLLSFQRRDSSLRICQLHRFSWHQYQFSLRPHRDAAAQKHGLLMDISPDYRTRYSGCASRGVSFLEASLSYKLSCAPAWYITHNRPLPFSGIHQRTRHALAHFHRPSFSNIHSIRCDTSAGSI